MTQDRVKSAFVISLEVAMKLALPFLLGMAGWTFTSITDHDRRLLKIEATRYTREMATSDIMSVTGTMDTMRSNQSEIQGTQQAVLARLANIETMLNRLLDERSRNGHP